MDFSKFSDQDLLALKAGDYSKLSRGALIYLKANNPKTGPSLEELQAEDKPVQDVSLTEALDAPFKAAQAAGEFGSQAATQAGMNPELAAGIGTGVAMIPHAVMAAKVPVKTMAGVIEGGISAVGSKIGGIVNTLKGPTAAEAEALGRATERAFKPETATKAAEYTKQLVEPIQGEVRQLGQRMTDLPGQTLQKTEMLEAALKEKGAAMGAAEEAGGFAFKSSPEFEAALKNPKTMNRALKAAEDFAQMGPEKVAETTDPKTIQLVRKLAQEGKEGVSNLGNASLQKGREVAGRALGLIDKKFGQARKEYQEVMDAINDLPVDQKKMASMLRSQLQAAKTKLAEAQTHAKDLARAAKDADRARFDDIKQQSLDLIRKGVEHDQLVRKIKGTVASIGTVGLGLIGYKKVRG